MNSRRVLYGSFFLDGKLASVITACTTHSVIFMPFSAIRADSQRRSYCLIM